MNFFYRLKAKNKQRCGLTLTEALFSLVCISLLMIAILSVTSFLKSISASARASATIEAYTLSIAETITQDLADGYDITDMDYNEDARFKNPNIYKEITLEWQEDVFGEMLYWVKVECIDKDTKTERVSQFFLRGGDY